MVARRVDNQPKRNSRRPATTPEARENQMIGYAVDLAEQQLRDGTASAQVITHFLKLGSSREKLEQERLAQENELLAVKREAIAAQGRIEELYDKALRSMSDYQGRAPDRDESDEFYD